MKKAYVIFSGFLFSSLIFCFSKNSYRANMLEMPNQSTVHLASFIGDEQTNVIPLK